MIKVTPGARRGLGDQTLNIIKNMKSKKGGPQILLFSATFEKQIIKYADKVC
jgi:superfamily II DNA/RNA helicase